MIGTVVNSGAIVAGALVGTLLQKAIPEKYKTTVMQGIGLAVVIIGIQMGLETKNPLIVVGALVLGALTGEAAGVEDGLEKIGRWLQGKIGSRHGNVVRGFVTASLVYCVGAMAIMGSLQDGLTGDPSILYIKSILDGVTAIVFASTLGIGVAFSVVPVFLYQGSITLGAVYLQPFLEPAMIREMTATGGLLILGIGLNLLAITKIRVGNLLPGLLFALAGGFLFPG
ncbi:MAG: DUF554 domain-containing protein [Heliobacteriaceae bacterium]|nr:DUF554 domain-containing protein [Heliobacteriaceae bacterium]